MKSTTPTRTFPCSLSTIVLALAIAIACSASFFVGGSAAAQQDEQELAAQKAEWQRHYRRLLQNAATLRDNAVRSRKNYAQAQRRNYPRGGARQQFLLDAENAEKELAEIQEEIERLLADARRAGIPRVWFWEVDDETITPAAPGDAPRNEEEDDREGRNPLYFEDDD